MASFLKKLRPGVPSVHDDGGDYSVEYSIAEEYKGPPLSYFIPEVAPFKLDQIPVATVAAAPPPNHLSVPVIQPFRKTNATKLKLHILSSSSEPFAIETSNSGMKLEVLSDEHQEDTGFHDEMNPIPTNSDATESGSSSPFVSSEIFPCGEEDHKDDPPSPKHVKRLSAVRFCDPESSYIAVDDDEFVHYQGGSVNYVVKPHAERAGKKGTCYRCLKGNRFTEREVCIVCSAKYCLSCVRRVMGCMPEGRKCVTCIGYRIDENKRRKLGKCSRLLKQLLSEEEVDQIMHNERFCDANQIPPELICVNMQPLNREQLTLLLNCRNPPRELTLGSYWYDKASGFWGKVKS